MAQDFLRSEAELVLTEARREKSERIKTLGSPIQLAGKALAIQIRDGHVWVAESAHIAKKIDLETGDVLQIYRGHTGPVTSLAFHQDTGNIADRKILITGSWDQTIKLWDTNTKGLISSTLAHSDFVKSLFVYPSLQLLISAGSDKIVRFWDLSTAHDPAPLTCFGSISSHIRPVECLDGKSLSDLSAILFTADTMGVIMVWNLEKDNRDRTLWRSSLRCELNHHRTRINEISYGFGYLWSASSDDTVQVLSDAAIFPDASTQPPTKSSCLISHPAAVRCILPLSLTVLVEPYLITGSGDIIRIFDISSLDETELIGQIDGHWHDVTALRLWMRKFVGTDKRIRIEPWIVSASLDGTIRKWRLSELLNPPVPICAVETKPLAPVPPSVSATSFEMTKEEEEELAELLDSD